MIKQFPYTQSSCVQLWWCSLPVCLPCGLVEDIVMSINVHHSILQEKLPSILDTTYLCVYVCVCGWVLCVCVWVCVCVWCVCVCTCAHTLSYKININNRLCTCREVVCFLRKTLQISKKNKSACTRQHVSSEDDYLVLYPGHVGGETPCT